MYNVAKEEIASTEFKSQITLMKINGLAVIPTYASGFACAGFIGVISDRLRNNTRDKLASAQYLSFMIDGSSHDREIGLSVSSKRGNVRIGIQPVH